MSEHPVHQVGADSGRGLLPKLLADGVGGILLFGITPPRSSATPDQVREIAAVTLARLEPLDLDGLVLYDIDDESDRNAQERPFPYLPTLDPAQFHDEYLRGWGRPAIIYRCVGKYPQDRLADWLRSADAANILTVFVGPSSREKPVYTRLDTAHALRSEIQPGMMLGGVAITERHISRDDEHERMLAKQAGGCAFFITQVVYDVDATKSMLSDYYYACSERGVVPRPVIFTLSVCGSLKTLAFLRWLGVRVPRWLENTLVHSENPLAESFEQCVASARDLIAFCRRLGLPFGFNIESVSIRKAEIDASVALARRVRDMLNAA